jgi:uncharacterized ubiquitin-like protein YukD
MAENEKKVQDGNDNLWNLTVITTEGNYKGEFNKHNHMHQVIDKTIKTLNLNVDQSQYDLLISGTTTILNPSKTLEDAGLADGSILEYRIRNGGGGLRF